MKKLILLALPLTLICTAFTTGNHIPPKTGKISSFNKEGSFIRYEFETDGKGTFTFETQTNNHESTSETEFTTGEWSKTVELEDRQISEAVFTVYGPAEMYTPNTMTLNIYYGTRLIASKKVSSYDREKSPGITVRYSNSSYSFETTGF